MFANITRNEVYNDLIETFCIVNVTGKGVLDFGDII